MTPPVGLKAFSLCTMYYSLDGMYAEGLIRQSKTELDTSPNRTKQETDVENRYAATSQQPPPTPSPTL
jgi:hypothetical protein